VSGDCDLCGSYDHVETSCDAFDDVPGPCAACGHDPACGFASVSIGDDERWYCHDDDCDCYSTAGAEAIAMAADPTARWRPLASRTWSAARLDPMPLLDGLKRKDRP
jgi:hypothetical protein